MTAVTSKVHKLEALIREKLGEGCAVGVCCVDPGLETYWRNMFGDRLEYFITYGPAVFWRDPVKATNETEAQR